MTILSETRAAIAELEALQRAKGFVTPKLLAECLPPAIRNIMSPYECAEVAKRINRAMYPEAQTALADVKNRAAGDT